MAREDMFPENEQDKSLLAKMVYNGKIMYFMDQTARCARLYQNWLHRQANKMVRGLQRGYMGLLFRREPAIRNDYQKIQKYLNEAPFTPGLGKKRFGTKTWGMDRLANSTCLYG
jgi:hypothetical protein